MVLGGLIKSAAKATYGTFEKVFATAVTVPANIITAGIEKVTGKTFARTTPQEFTQSSFGSKVTKAAAVPAAGLIIAAGAGGRAATFAKSLIPTTIKGKLFAATAGLVGYGILKESPTAQSFTEKAIEGLPDKPGVIVEFGAEVGKVIEGVKEFTPKDVAKGVAAAGVVGGVFGAAALLIPKIGKNKAPSETGGLIETPLGQEQYAVLPETVDISKTPPKKRPYKPRTAKKTPSVRQYVKVNIINKPVNTGIRVYSKKYINQRLLN